MEYFERPPLKRGQSRLAARATWLKSSEVNHRDTLAQRRKLDALSSRVIGLAMEVHRTLGPGLLESAYEEALALEFAQSGLRFQRQLETPIWYKGTRLDCGYRTDFTVEDELIVELKAVNELLPVHHAQLLTYLKLQRHTVGLLINFNVPVLKDGIRRVVAGTVFQDKAGSGID